MSISEQVIKLQIKELRDYERIFKGDRIDGNLSPIFGNAAGTIKSLSTQLKAENFGKSKANYCIGDLSDLIEKFDNEKIKGITDFEQAQVFNALKYLDMYQRVGTIDEFMELKQNMERSASDCGGWIPCKERLPEENKEVICCFKSGIVEAFVLYNCKFHGKVYACEKSDIIAWQPLPAPYHES